MITSDNIFVPKGIKTGPILVAVSGGADSVAMLYLLSRNSRIMSKHGIVVAHFNHGIRANDADDDLDFVRKLAKSLSFEFVGAHANVPSEAERTGESIEMAARRLRWDFLYKTAKAHSCVAIAVGHNADDQLETIFLRLARGAGLRGLGGIHPQSAHNDICVFRPVLEFRHRQLCEYLTENNIAWREDTTNNDMGYLRNRIRKMVVPNFEQVMGDGVLKTITRSMSLLRADNDFIEALTKQAFSSCCADGAICISQFVEYAEPIRRRILLDWLYNTNIPEEFITGTTVSRIDEACAKPRKGTKLVSIYMDTFARVCNNTLEIACQKDEHRDRDVPCTRIRIDENRLPTIVKNLHFKNSKNLKLVVSWVDEVKRPKRSNPLSMPQHCCLDPSVLSEPLEVRCYKYGDRISPAGVNFTRKLSDIFTDMKIPRHSRKDIPLLANGNDILWVPGYAVSKSAAVKNTLEKSLLFELSEQ